MSPASLDQAEFRAIRQRLLQAFEQRLAGGKLPYEGEWLDAQEIHRRQAARESRARVQFRELVAGLALFALVGAVPLLIVVSILY